MPRKRVRWTIGLVTALLSLLAGGSATAGVPSAPHRSETATTASGTTISGTVTLSNGKPVRDGEVDLYQGGSNRAGIPASTDRHGHYTIEDVAPGRYRVCSLASYQRFETACYAGTGTGFDQATTLTVGSQPLTGIDIAFAAPGTVVGTVTVAGRPLAGVDVTLYYRTAYLQGYGDDRAFEVPGPYVQTNDRGAFVFRGVSPGTYSVAVDATDRSLLTFNGGAARLAKAGSVTVQSHTASRADIAAIPAATITGTMESQDGTPQAGYVSLYAANPQTNDGNPLATDQVDADGSYTFGPVKKGRYLVDFSPNDPLLQSQWYGGAATRESAQVLTVSGPGTVSGVDSALPAAGDITGTVTDGTTGRAVSGFPTVTLSESDGAHGWTVVATEQGYYGYGGGVEGAYDFPHLAPGTYRISVTQGGYHPVTVDQAPDTEIAGGQTLTQEVVLQRDTSIVGTLTVGSQTSNVPAPYVTIDVYQQAADGTFQEVAAGNESNRVGDYVVSGLAPGTYRIGFEGTCCTQGEFYKNAVSLATATDIVVTQDHWSRADALLAQPN